MGWIAITIWTALFFFLSSAGTRGLQRKQNEKPLRWARLLWTFGMVAYVAHVLLAFHLVHAWSHAAAIEHVAEQSEQVVGWRFGAGIWFNHLFTLLVISETVWWWANAHHYQTRKLWINLLIFGYLGFIAFNGAVVF